MQECIVLVEELLLLFSQVNHCWCCMAREHWRMDQEIKRVDGYWHL